MSYEVFRVIFLVGLILAIVLFATSILLFFVLKIPVVIGDLTGSNERKAIENIRNKNMEDSSFGKTKKTSGRTRKTDKISNSGRIVANSAKINMGEFVTAKISPQSFDEETTLLSDETTLLQQQPMANETVVLDQSNIETTVLGQNNIETTVLGQNQYPLAGATDRDSIFEIEFDITYIHTNEIINAE